MPESHERRGFFRLVGGAVAGAAVLGATQACDGEEPVAQPSASGKPSVSSPSPSAVATAEEMMTFPPGPVSEGTNIPKLAEGGRLHSGARQHTVEVLWRLDVKQKLVALTFDDGPSPELSPMLYDILDETKARATFFMVGSRVLSSPRLIHGRMDRHEIGNHTNSHRSMFALNREEAIADLTTAHRAITGVTGREPVLLRPPYGHVNGNTLLASAAMGYDIVMWDNYIGDKAYENDEDKLVADVVEAAAPGQIVLGHDAGETRRIGIRNVPNIIKELRRRGYEFVTVSEMRQASRSE